MNINLNILYHISVSEITKTFSFIPCIKNIPNKNIFFF